MDCYLLSEESELSLHLGFNISLFGRKDFKRCVEQIKKICSRLTFFQPPPTFKVLLINARDEEIGEIVRGKGTNSNKRKRDKFKLEEKGQIQITVCNSLLCN